MDRGGAQYLRNGDPSDPRRVQDRLARPGYRERDIQRRALYRHGHSALAGDLGNFKADGRGGV